MTNEIQQNRYDRLIRRVGGIIGTGSKVSEVLTELFPMIDVETDRGELQFLSGTQLCFGGGITGPTANVAPKFQLFNPAGSGKLVTITRVMFTCNASAVHRWGRSTAVFGSAIGTETFRDTRNAINTFPTSDIRQLEEAALAAGTNQVQQAGNSATIIEDINSVMVLAPGTGFEIGSGNNNVKATFAISWRERVAEPSELP